MEPQPHPQPQQLDSKETASCWYCSETYEPMYQVCKCTGSIGLVHESCFMTWRYGGVHQPIKPFTMGQYDSTFVCKICETPYNINVFQKEPSAPALELELELAPKNPGPQSLHDLQWLYAGKIIIDLIIIYIVLLSCYGFVGYGLVGYEFLPCLWFESLLINGIMYTHLLMGILYIGINISYLLRWLSTIDTNHLPRHYFPPAYYPYPNPTYIIVHDAPSRNASSATTSKSKSSDQRQSNEYTFILVAIVLAFGVAYTFFLIYTEFVSKRLQQYRVDKNVVESRCAQ